ncbi:MAG: hypothetical protein DLM68_02090 [Hyphomicrobiales bacterium]|nr:MAG: hypothetical protein DLM68_02090 [Hyphomicrobiales bacterium]
MKNLDLGCRQRPRANPAGQFALWACISQPMLRTSRGSCKARDGVIIYPKRLVSNRLLEKIAIPIHMGAAAKP